ncbi:MAG: hypothetical protein EA341_16785 [Mongoliibacter sp.]|nr:MAG: hypothetical protein EA341_16785 [Mongoliibacter sp.]
MRSFFGKFFRICVFHILRWYWVCFSEQTESAPGNVFLFKCISWRPFFNPSKGSADQTAQCLQRSSAPFGSFWVSAGLQL